MSKKYPSPVCMLHHIIGSSPPNEKYPSLVKIVMSMNSLRLSICKVESLFIISN